MCVLSLDTLSPFPPLSHLGYFPLAFPLLLLSLFIPHYPFGLLTSLSLSLGIFQIRQQEQHTAISYRFICVSQLSLSLPSLLSLYIYTTLYIYTYKPGTGLITQKHGLSGSLPWTLISQPDLPIQLELHTELNATLYPTS